MSLTKIFAMEKRLLSVECTHVHLFVIYFSLSRLTLGVSIYCTLNLVFELANVRIYFVQLDIYYLHVVIV